MQTSSGHLTYCSNIHAGESWADHFHALKTNIPSVKKKLSPDKPFGIGLRLSHIASLDLGKKENLQDFKHWLDETQCYVFVINGFPDGGQHWIDGGQRLALNILLQEGSVLAYE